MAYAKLYKQRLQFHLEYTNSFWQLLAVFLQTMNLWLQTD